MHTVKWFQIFLFNTSTTIKDLTFVCIQLNAKTVLFQTIQFNMSTKLNGFKSCYLSLTIQLDISHLFVHSTQFLSNTNNYFIIICLHTVKWFQVFLFNASTSIKDQTFFYKQLNAKTVLFQTIQFNISTKLNGFK